jgi:phosphate transport system substrate-binding protein
LIAGALLPMRLFAIMKTTGLALCFLILLPSVISSAQAGDVAVIVNNDNPIQTIGFQELAKIFKIEKKFWDNGEKIYLVLRETGSPEKSVILKQIYKTDDPGLKTLWLSKIYREEITSFPKTLNSNEAVIRFVRQVPNAIGFIDAALIDDRVKVLRIDGLLPGEKDYPLTEN